LRATFERIGLSEAMFQFRAFTRLKQLQHLTTTGQIDAALRWRPLPVTPAVEPAA
jgi:hypothetical protein